MAGRVNKEPTTPASWQITRLIRSLRISFNFIELTPATIKKLISILNYLNWKSKNIDTNIGFSEEKGGN